MPDCLTLLFYHGSGPAAWLERAACRFPCQAMGDVPGHVAVQVGTEDAVFEAVASGVRRVGYGEAARRTDLMREIALPVRSEMEIAARGYAEACVGEAYSWGEIELTAWAWAAPGVVASFSRHWRERAGADRRIGRQGAICSLFAMLVLAHGGCRLHECVAPATTPNELLMRAEDYAWDEGAGIGAKSGECAARSG